VLVPLVPPVPAVEGGMVEAALPAVFPDAPLGTIVEPALPVVAGAPFEPPTGDAVPPLLGAGVPAVPPAPLTAAEPC
jgi:hypothetical protein